MEENELILSKIQKLLRLSTSSNPNEAAVAAGKAQELLLKYNLSLTQVEGYSAEKIEPIIENYQYMGNTLADWKATLAFVVAKNNLCRAFTSGSRIVWVGKDTNIQVAKYLSDTLAADLERLATLYWNGILKLRELGLATGEQQFVHGRVYKQSFYTGAVSVIRERLTGSKQSLMQDTNMYALVVVEDRALDLFMRRYNLTSRGSTNRSGQLGFSAGREAGASVSFKTGVGAGGSVSPKQIRG